MLAGKPAVNEIVDRLTHTLGRRWRWLRPLARRFAKSSAGHVRPRHRDVVEFLVNDPGFERAWRDHSSEIEVEHWLNNTSEMLPVAAAESWDRPAIQSAGALAEWLLLYPNELDWYADLKGLG
jgi:hypothetical protein